VLRSWSKYSGLVSMKQTNATLHTRAKVRACLALELAGKD